MRISRRDAFKVGFSSMAYYSTLASTPHWISRSAQALDRSADGHGDRILVILQHDGGNDGLNTVISYTDDKYRTARPALGVPLGKQLTIDELNGLHPQLQRLADRYWTKGKSPSCRTWGTSVFDANVYDRIIRPELPKLACLKSETVAAVPRRGRSCDTR